MSGTDDGGTDATPPGPIGLEEFERILHDLSGAGRGAREWAGDLVVRAGRLEDPRPTPPVEAAATVEPVEPVEPVEAGEPGRTAETVRPAPSAPPVRTTVESAGDGDVVRNRTPGLERTLGAARSTAVVVLTLFVVLGGWLLVLEPLLGSRPVLVSDERMAPSLRAGDVAIADRGDAPVVVGSIVAARVDGRVRVTRVVDRVPAAPDASDEERAAVPLILLADGDPIGTGVEVERDDVIGVVGSAVPRIGLPFVWLRSPTTAPVGTLVVLVVMGLTGIGLRELVLERRERRGRIRAR